MNAVHGRGFRALPVKVALIATAVVAILYAVTATALVVLSRNALVGGVDARLARQLSAVQANPDAVAEALSGDTADLDNDGDERRFDAPLVVWIHATGGGVFQTDAATPLPAQYESQAGPVTARIGATDMRLVGGPLPTGSGSGWITIGQSLGEATSAVNALIVVEVLLAPALLVVVFIGALLVGRRVAHPIEQARVAQLAFTADASHELRTPLAVIQAETSLALQEQHDAATRQTLGRIQDETKVLQSLVDDLLWLARFDSSPTAPDSEPVDVAALASAISERFAPIASQRGTAIENEASGSAAAVINAPPEWMARLLSVLIDNAVGHSPPGSHVAINVGADGGRVLLSVEDDGPGIPIDQREHVFNRFHRATDSREGAGLGLAIADAIVRATDGRWDIGESASGGARIAVWWQRVSDAAYATALSDQS